jgi:hypothetical protein
MLRLLVWERNPSWTVKGRSDSKSLGDPLAFSKLSREFSVGSADGSCSTNGLGPPFHLQIFKGAGAVLAPCPLDRLPISTQVSFEAAIGKTTQCYWLRLARGDGGTEAILVLPRPSQAFSECADESSRYWWRLPFSPSPGTLSMAGSRKRSPWFKPRGCRKEAIAADYTLRRRRLSGDPVTI